MLEQSRNEKKLLAIERAKFRLHQRLQAIDWEYDHLKPLVNEFKGKAQLPELPTEHIVEVEWEEADDDAESQDQESAEA